MRLSLWPQSLFGRLIAASILALLFAQVVSLVMVARERERFILQGSVREWSRRIAEVTAMLQTLDASDREAVVARLSARPWRFSRRPPDVIMLHEGPFPAPELERYGPPPGAEGLAPQPEGVGPPGGAEPPRNATANESGAPVKHGASPGGPKAAATRGSRPSGPSPAGGVHESAPGSPETTAASTASTPSGPGAAAARKSTPTDSGAPTAGGPMPDGPPGLDDGWRGHLLGSNRDEPRPGRPGGREDSRALLLRATTYQVIVPFTHVGDFESTFEQQLHSVLGSDFDVHVTPVTDPSTKAIPISGPLFSDTRDIGQELYDATVKFPDDYTAVFRVTRLARGAPLPRGLFVNLAFLLVIMSIVLFVAARSITRPLSDLAAAADSVGRDLRQPRIAERGARELRNAARAFNTMQDRLQRYLDSRSRVLAAMSHDLKTPLTRLRLQVEMLDDMAAQARLGKQLDEMESMVHGALALFRGLDDNEAFTPIDINEMLTTLESEFAEMSAKVTVEGHATRSILGKPQALRRCLTNLIANAVKFGTQAWVIVEDGPALVIRVRDDGPGIPEDQLERVFEPFYRVESSRNRDTGGTGLGLSIARDVIQAHGGSLVLRNLPVRGLEATVTLPRESS